MNLPVDSLTQAALLLSLEDRAALAARLIGSIEESTDISEAWLDVAEQRRDDVLSGKAETVSAREVDASVRRHIS